MPPDREAILARRALFLASALAGIASPGRARPEVAGPTACPPREPPSAEEKAAAKALFEQGSEAAQQGDHATALELFRKAHTLSGVPLLLLHLADAERHLGDFTAAHAHLSELVRCADTPRALREAQEQLARLEAETVQLGVEGGAPGTSVEVDGKLAGTLPLAAALRLRPGRHRIALVGASCASGQTLEVELGLGETRVVRFESECEPRVCLQPCLSPPPPPPPSSLPRLGVGVGTLAAVGVRRGDTEPALLLGARLEAFHAAPLGEAFSARLGVAASPATGEGGSLIPVGADVAVVATPGALRIALGATSGWAFSSFARSEPESWRPRSSFFVEPYLQPLGFRATDHIEAGAHVGFLLGKWTRAEDETFRLGFVTTSLWIRVYFGEAHRDWEDVAFTSGRSSASLAGRRPSAGDRP